MISIIDRRDQSGYIASDQFQTPAWSFGRGGTQNGRFERETAMINPFAAQSMILGDTDTSMITEQKERKNN